MGSRGYGHPVLDAWVQPWTPEIVSAMPARNFALVDKYGGEGARRLREGFAVEALVEEMDEAGVDRALCSAGPLIPVDAVEDAVRRWPDRLVGIGSTVPFRTEGVMTAVEELRRQVEVLGFKGLKIEPFLDDHPPNAAQWYPLYAACIDLDVAVQLQVGNTGPPSYSSHTGKPLYVDRIAVDFPELRIVAGHIGWPWTEEMIAIAWKHPNIWIDTSAHLPRHFPERFTHFLTTFGREKCIWATDWPILDFGRALDQVDTLGLDEGVRRRFLHDDAVRAFRLDS